MKRATILVTILGTCISLMAQTATLVNGVVLDAHNKTPLPYVALFFEATALGTLSNSGGQFSIHATDSVVNHRKLKVMFTGYCTQEIYLHADSLHTVEIYLVPLAHKENIPILETIRVMGNKGHNLLAHYLYQIINIVLNDNFPLGNQATNKVDLYRIKEIPSYNHLEGVRLRLSAATNARLHPNLFAKGYLGYGFKDQKPKYRGEVAWSFNKKAYHDDEFPRNNIRLIHENDIFSPGQNHPRLQNNFLLYSYTRSQDAMTYRKFTELNYEKETLYGLSYQLWARVSEIEPVPPVAFRAVDTNSYTTPMPLLKSNRAGLSLRYYPGHAYIQNKRSRTLFSHTQPLFVLSHTVGHNSLFGGNELYHKTELSFQQRYPLGQHGHLDLVADYQRVWTKAPFPLLLYPNANRGFIVDNKAFFLVRAMDFINDELYSIRATYVAHNLLFARVPILNALGFRELFILRGFQGSISNKNIPTKHNGLFLLPQQTITMTNTPYLEAAVGITNILGVLRVEYIHRLTYRHHPGVLKYGVRFDATF